MLQLFKTLLQALTLIGIRCKQARLQMRHLALMIHNQQGFGEVETVVRAALLLIEWRQRFEPSDQVIGEQAAEEHGFAFIVRANHQRKQLPQSIEGGQRAQTRIFVLHGIDGRKGQLATIRTCFNPDFRRQRAVQQRE